MWFMSQLTIRGWFTGARLVPGRDGIHILEFGLGDLTCHSALALALAGSEASAGAGDIGDSIGAADIRCMVVPGISRAAQLSTTGLIFTGVEELTEGAAVRMEPAAARMEHGTEPMEGGAALTRDAWEHKPAGIWRREAE